MPRNTKCCERDNDALACRVCVHMQEIVYFNDRIVIVQIKMVKCISLSLFLSTLFVCFSLHFSLLISSSLTLSPCSEFTLAGIDIGFRLHQPKCCTVIRIHAFWYRVRSFARSPLSNYMQSWQNYRAYTMTRLALNVMTWHKIHKTKIKIWKWLGRIANKRTKNAAKLSSFEILSLSLCVVSNFYPFLSFENIFHLRECFDENILWSHWLLFFMTNAK